MVIIKKSLYSGSLFFLDVFLFCCHLLQSNYTFCEDGKIILLCQYANLWQMTKKLECLLNDKVLKLNCLPMIHAPFYSTVRYFCVTFHSEMNWEFLKAALCCFSIWKWWFQNISIDLFTCNRESGTPAGMA